MPSVLASDRISVTLSPAVSLSMLSAHKFYHNFSPQNNGAHVKVIPRLGVSNFNENKLGRQSSIVARPTNYIVIAAEQQRRSENIFVS